MTYQSAYRSTYRRHRYRHRRRNSHYGVLIALILVVIIAVPVAFHIVKGISSAIFGGDRNQLVYQIDNDRAYSDGQTVDLGGAAPYRDTSGNVFVSVKSLCDNLGLELSWEDSSKTAVITARKDTLRAQVDSKTIQFNDESRTISAAPAIKDGTAYVPVRDICQAFSWQVGELDANMGDLVVVSQSKKELDDERMGKIADEALVELGPSEQQLASDSVLMRTGSDKLQYQGDVLQMKEDGSHRGLPVTEQDGLQYVPLDAAMNALGGTATFDGDNEWTVSFNGLESTVRDSGKTKVDGKRVRGDDIRAYTDSDSGRFYVSAPLFAALLDKTYTALDDGSFVFAVTSLDGFDSQKAYLSGQTNGLTQAVGGDIPDADVYIALTFDDGPTGKKDGYPNGLTNYLLDGLKQRGAVATFLMVGERVSEVSDVLPRMVNEGHELGNHTMNHPMCHLTGLGVDDIRTQIDDATNAIKDIAGQAPQVLRPVGGGVNSDVKAVAAELGYPIINWSMDTEDWKYRDADHVKKVIVEQAQDGDVVLMHDLYETSVRGALAAIDELQSRTDKTYAFVTVSQLAAIHGITLEPGVVYNALSDEVAQQIADGSYSPTEFT